MAMTLGASVMNVMLRDERNAAVKNEERAVKNEVRAVDAEKKIQRERDQAMDNLWASYLAEVRALRNARQTGFRSKGLEVVKKASKIKPALELRNEAAALLTSSDISVVAEHDRRMGDYFWADLDQMGQVFVRSNNRGDLSVRSVKDDVELYRLAGPGLRPVNTVFSPSGNYLAVKYMYANQNPRVILWDLRTKAAIWQTNSGWPDIYAFSPDDRWLAMGTHPNEWILFDLMEKKVAKSIKQGPTLRRRI